MQPDRTTSAAHTSGGTAVPPGNCPTHGYHGRTYCPRCSTSAIPPPPLGQAPSAAKPPWHGNWYREWSVGRFALEIEWVPRAHCYTFSFSVNSTKKQLERMGA